MENLSGVKAHTIRIWEKRYNIVEPKRTKTNIRYYTDEDLRRLLNVCFLYRNGYKISKIAQMSSEDLNSNVAKHSRVELDFEDELDALLLFILELDSYNFNKVLNNHISQNGLVETMNQVIYPLLDKLSVAWLAGSFQEVHESFVSQIIKSKILYATELLKEENDFKPKYLIYLPKGEKQELSLLYLNFLLKQNRCKVINLGIDIHLKDVILAHKSCKPEYVFTIINEELNNISFEDYVNELCNVIEDNTFVITGYQAVVHKIQWPTNVKRLKDLKETIAFIESTTVD